MKEPMKRAVKVHPIRVDFKVTEQVQRYVYVYLIEAKSCYLVDSGVAGSEKQIVEYMEHIGRDLSELKGIFLTHAHPDHIGTAAWFKQHTGCRIYASRGERAWIEDIDQQYQQRPIPNFYRLAGKSVAVDGEVQDGDRMLLEENLELQVLATAGHAIDDVSYRLGDCLFTGDAIPVNGDIPIYINRDQAIRTLQKLSRLEGIDHCYPAWDHTYTASEMQEKLEAARNLIHTLDAQVQAVLRTEKSGDITAITDQVCCRMKMPFLKENPLFRRTIAAHCVAEKAE